MSSYRIVALLAFLVLAGPTCLAQSETTDAGDENAEPRKHYLVEVIVFRHLGPDSSTGETFDRLFVSDYFPSEPFDIAEHNRVRDAVSYTQMKHLSNARERLRADRQYRIMSSAAWTQPLLSKEEAIDVAVGAQAGTSTSSLHAASGGATTDRLTGSVTVYGDYLLFVDVNLRAEFPRERGVRETDSSGEEGFVSLLGSGERDAEERGPDVYHLSEKRRIKLEEFHYFDHPYIGAIVSVTRHEEAEAASAEQ